MLVKRLLTAGAVLGGAGVGLIEARFRRHPGNDLAFVDHGWSTEREAPDTVRAGGRVTVRNLVARREVMLVDVGAEVRLVSTSSVEELHISARVRSHEPNYPARPDGYWTAYVIKPGRHGQDVELEVAVDLTGPSAALDAVYGVWVAVQLSTYGFEGYRLQWHHVVLSLGEPAADDVLPWQDASTGEFSVKAVRTHLLCPFDDPVKVVEHYAAPHTQPGDIVTLGESPLAVMQGRFRDPRQHHARWFATRMAQFMSGEGALGTASGMQALVDEVGAPRVFLALVGGAAAKTIGRRGWFYRLAGPQARLFDDVTGALPPYDKFIVAGPERADDVCTQIKAATGLEAAIVDANDLGKVDIVGRSSGVPDKLVRAALRSNPAGNSDESTPLVIIRPPSATGAKAT